MSLLLDPFDTTPDANPAECETRPKSRFAMKYVDPLGDSGKKPKKTDLNPIQRRWFDKQGWVFSRVEHANAWGNVSVDLWGFADYLCVAPEGIFLIQTTSRPNMAARLKKAEATTELRAWLGKHGRFEVHGWEKEGRFWQVKRTAVQLVGGALVRTIVADRRAGA